MAKTQATKSNENEEIEIDVNIANAKKFAETLFAREVDEAVVFYVYRAFESAEDEEDANEIKEHLERAWDSAQEIFKTKATPNTAIEIFEIKYCEEEAD